MSHRRIRKATSNRSSHDTQTLEMLHELRERSEQQSHIRQRPRSYQPSSPLGLSHQRMPHGQDGIRLRYRLRRWLRQEGRAIEAGYAFVQLSMRRPPPPHPLFGKEERTVYISRMHGIPAKRLRRSRMDGHVGPPNGREDAQGVLRRLLEGGVAVDGADAEEAQGRTVGGEEDGEGVLEAALALERRSRCRGGEGVCGAVPYVRRGLAFGLEKRIGCGYGQSFFALLPCCTCVAV